MPTPNLEILLAVGRTDQDLVQPSLAHHPLPSLHPRHSLGSPRLRSQTSFDQLSAKHRHAIFYAFRGPSTPLDVSHSQSRCVAAYCRLCRIQRLYHFFEFHRPLLHRFVRRAIVSVTRSFAACGPAPARIASLVSLYSFTSIWLAKRLIPPTTPPYQYSNRSSELNSAY